MIRTQIQLTEEQAARLKAVAARRGVSMAEVIRKAVDTAVLRIDDLDGDARYERARRIAGKFRSGANDISARHDDHLAGSFAP